MDYEVKVLARIASLVLAEQALMRLFGLFAVGVLFVSSGFARAAADNHQNNQNNEKKHHNDIFMGGPETESQLADEIRHRLVMLPYYSIFSELGFQLSPGGVVTLTGACPPDPPWNIKSDAENVVKNIPGVTKVINDIKLLPLSPMDWQIRRAVARAIYGDPQIGTRYGYQALPPIHIIVDNGHVTLTGVVDNQFDDTLIRTRANSVPNVFSVTDDLVVLNKKQK